jgi:hypothetical protein
MHDSPPSCPSLALRVGITGTRRLRENQRQRIRLQVDGALLHLKEKLGHLANVDGVRNFYCHSQNQPVGASLRMISPLARGSDRLAASLALKHGYSLYVPLPFQQLVYEEDFTGRGENDLEESPLSAEADLAEFRELFGRASGHITLDGVRDSPHPTSNSSIAGYSYDYVGRFVVRHSDILLAVWDGKASNGRGGTEEIVHYAATVGVPILWIHSTDDTAPVYVANLSELRDPIPTTERSTRRLEAHLERIIKAPGPVYRHHHNGVGHAIRWIAKSQVSPVAEYFNEVPLRNRPIWKTYGKVIDVTSGFGHLFGRFLHSMTEKRESHSSFNRRKPTVQQTLTEAYKGITLPKAIPSSPGSISEPQTGHKNSYWPRFYEPADARAVEYAARYRSSYTLVILFAAVGLFAGFVSELLPLREFQPTHSLWISTAAWAFGFLEFVMPFLVLGLVFLTLIREWHEKSIEYRLLAELFRKQQTLDTLGWALPIGSAEHLAETDRLHWVTWLFGAAQRSAPFPKIDLSHESQRRLSKDALLGLVAEQLHYHQTRQERALNSAATLEWLGGITFIGAWACVIMQFAAYLDVHLSLGTHNPYAWFFPAIGLTGSILPVLSAAFVGFRSYAELQLLADQSRHMIVALQNAERRIERLDLNRPIVSRDLGAEAVAVTTLMLEDLEGWGRLFRGKSMEP